MTSQHTFHQSNPLQSQSLTFSSGQLSQHLTFDSKSKADDDMLALKKQMRQKEAEFMKERAILQQNVELLKMQLQESAEREINLKNMNENIMNAIRREETPNKNQHKVEIDEHHPQVQEILMNVKQEYQQRLTQEKERHRDTEYKLEKEIQHLQFKMQDVTRRLEIKDQDLNRKDVDIRETQKRQDQNVKSLEEKVRGESYLYIMQLEKELESLNADIERQVSIRLNERYLKEQNLNESIIKYQREQQMLLTEQNQLRCKIEQLEKEILGNKEKSKKTEDENGALRIKVRQTEKKLKEEIEVIKKQKEEAQKKIEAIYGKQKKATTSRSTTGTIKSRNQIDKLVQNKENIEDNNKTEEVQDDEEKNKLRRQISLMRCQIKKLEIELKDTKSRHQKEMVSMKDKLNVERKKRINIYEEKIDKNSSLLQDLLEKDQIIFALNKQLSRVTERLQLYQGGARSHTPNNRFGNSLQESMNLQNLGASIMDFQTMAQQSASFTSRQMLSPLRSLDLTLNNGSFSMILPLGKKDRPVKNLKQKKMQLSPQQIKRNRGHSFKINGSQTLTSSITRFKQTSRDASIAEVNEDLYKDSVESLGGNDINDFDQENIMIPYRQNKNQLNRKAQTQKVRFNSKEKQADNELTQALLGQGSEVYFDSLENSSMTSQENQTFFTSKNKGSVTCRNQLPKQQFKKSQKQQQEIEAPRYTSGSDGFKLTSQMNEDEDCLVNILEHEENNIEMQPTLHNPRLCSSTDNLLKDISKAFETLKSENLKAKQHINKVKHAKKPLQAPPRPIPSLQLSKAAAFQFKESDQFDTERFKQKQANYPELLNADSNILKSPSSPILSFQNELNSKNSSESQNPRRMTRMDSCPSPLDEDETVVMLGSGEKLRVKEVSTTRMNSYQGQFQEQRHLFNSILSKQSQYQVFPQQQPQQQQQYSFRTRTNSLINSCQADVSLKMKFIRDMPTNNTYKQQQANHTRVPSTSKSSNTSLIQTGLAQAISKKLLK